MATIAIRDLNPTGYSLFDGSESYLAELSSDDELDIYGGKLSSALGFSVGTVIGVTIVASLVYLLS
uniref:Uncharacterized protein n=1 Tax=Synechocystis sp. PCC 9413 TaxID=77760 RepID=A0A2P0ZGE2_9SYNC|nr:hypothetical protein [Synechocystis sp. PCC 9413]